MILTIFYYLITTTLYLILTLFLLISSTVLWLKLKYEPIKGKCTSKARLDGKTVLVTGGNQGIGLETARDLVARGARVVIACRNGKKAAEAIADIIATTGNKNIEYIHLDLASFRSIRKFVEEFHNSYDRLDILVNNAGCGGLEPNLTEDGNDMVMQINYIGPFLLTNLLLDKIIASKPSRIVNVSSIFHDFASLQVERIGALHGPGYKGKLLQYNNSKLCQILQTKALVKRLPEGVTVYSLHPGAVKTDIFKNLLPWIQTIVYTFINLFFKTPKEGAQTSIYCCVSEDLENVTGKYYIDCKEFKYNKVVDDDDLVESVWKKSIQLTSNSGKCIN